MGVFTNIRIIKKIGLALLLLLVISFAVAGLNFTSISEQEATSAMTAHTYQVIGEANLALASMIDQETGIRGYLVSGDEKFLEPQKAGSAAFKQHWQTLKGLTSDNPAQQKRLDGLSALAAQWEGKVVDAIKTAMAKPDSLDAARAIEASGAGKQSMDAIRAEVAALIGAEKELLTVRAAAAADAATFAKRTTLAGSALLLLIGGFSLFALSRTLVRPLVAVNEGMMRLASGDTQFAVPALGRADEIGEMASSLESFRVAIAEKQAVEQRLNAEQAASEEDRRQKRVAEEARVAEMAAATTGIGNALQRLAEGDLTFRLDTPFASDFEGLRANFNAAIAQLTETMRAVSHAAGSIDGGTQELSTSANDLSKRTEQQAAALEETAAALDEITSNVGSSTKRTAEARTKAEQANESARRSGAIMKDAVSAMQRIEKSSAEIGNIISVIDEIAFQTNLLALNAGVEAARAGEAGKGFAVVAQEVRELAQRSAKAAKEIKELIRTSADEVANGVRLVTETGSALQVIESHVVDINEQLNAIATAAQEQSVGLQQVNTAVNQMDQSTQQNAAMVEETTAASAALANEAERLRSLIGQFRVAGGVAAAMGARPAASGSSARQMINRVAEAFTPKKRVAGGGASGGWDEF